MWRLILSFGLARITHVIARSAARRSEEAEQVRVVGSYSSDELGSIVEALIRCVPFRPSWGS